MNFFFKTLLSHKINPLEDYGSVLRQVLKWILMVLMVIGLPTVTIGVVEAFKLGQSGVAMLYIFFFSILILVTIFQRKLKYKLSAAIVLFCIYLFAVHNLFIYGFSGAAIPIFLAFFILITIFFGTEAGLWSLLAAIIPMGVVGYLMVNNIISLQVNLLKISTLPISWVTAASVTFLTGSLVIVVFSFIQNNLFYIVRITKDQSDELKKINARLKQEIQNKEIIQKDLELAKEKAEKSEERYQNFIAQSSEGIYRFELKNPIDIKMEVEAQIDLIYEDSYLAECNNKFVEMYGASSVNDLLGLSLVDLHGGKNNPDNRKEIRDFVEQNYRITNRVTVEATRAGETVYFSNNTIGILENNKLVRMWGIQADVTQQKLMEQHLIAAKEKAEESDRLKSAFLANMSHEIRTPMNGIMGFSQMLQEREFPKEKQNKFLSIIHSRTTHLLQIISDIVDVAKLESNQMSVYPQEFYLNDVLNELNRLYKKEIEQQQKKELQLEIDLGLNRSQSYFRSDPTRIRQVMDNLLSNAIKFTEKGKVEFGYKQESEKTLLFWVKDTGIGLSQDDYDKIFERFRQVNDSSNRLYEGTGLGLTISKSLIELLGGKMWVESEQGKGSVFYFTLPYEYKTGEKHKNSKPVNEEFNWQGRQILMVEDDPTTIEYMKEIIEPTGANLIVEETGEEGYKAYKENSSLDLILMDLRLSDINGMDIIKRIRKEDNKMKIIAQTAHAMGEDREKCLAAGANDYIAKPIGMIDLLNIINKYL
jgi:signal transduction histidine kinase